MDNSFEHKFTGKDSNTENKKYSYDSFPELKPGMLPSRTGFSQESIVNNSRDFFLECLEEAIRNPDWLLVSQDDPQYEIRKSKREPRAQSVRCKDQVERLKRNFESKDLRKLAEDIESLNDRTSHVRDMIWDIMIRVLEIMVKKHPELRVYRGADFSPETGFSGIDFAPGDLVSALKFGIKSYYHVRPEPVLVSLKISDIIHAYSEGKLILGSEGTLWRNSIEIMAKSTPNQPNGVKVADFATIFRLPKDVKNIDAIIADYNAHSIDLVK